MGNKTLVLLGDSILDNQTYTSPKPDTAAHLKRLLGADWSVLLLARDGATLSDVRAQLGALEGKPATVVLSIGGNDAIDHAGVLEREGTTSAEVLAEVLAIAEEFGRGYEAVARAVAARAERTILCTIYEIRLEPARLARLARVPLALLDDQIVRVGARLGLDVLELRSICTEAADFVMQIEPSAQGAGKIANAIAAAVDPKGSLSSARVFSARG